LFDGDIRLRVIGFTKSVVHQNHGRVARKRRTPKKAPESDGNTEQNEAPKVAFGAQLRQAHIHGTKITAVSPVATSHYVYLRWGMPETEKLDARSKWTGPII
jgi:hypothetical protein